jgi:PRTRC genetic system protein A
MSARVAEHHFARRGEQLPPVDEYLWLDYVVGASGIYARGRQPGLEVCMPVSPAQVRGLKGVEPYVQWGFPRLPARFLDRMVGAARSQCRHIPTEALFHLTFNRERAFEPTHEGSQVMDFHEGWHLEFPVQNADADYVRPVHQGKGSSEDRAVIEVHSHPWGDAFFSEVDDKDEGGLSFKVYAVIGHIFDRPEIRCRVGLFGHFMTWTASEFFEVPDFIKDCLAR